VQIGGGVRVGDAFQAIVETETHRHMGNGELRPNFSTSEAFSLTGFNKRDRRSDRKGAESRRVGR